MPSAWIMSRTRPSTFGMFQALQCSQCITHSHFDELCQSPSIVLSAVLAVPVNRRMPHFDDLVDWEMIGMLSVSWSCTSSKSMTSAKMPRARSGEVLAYVSWMPEPFANDWCPTAVRIFESDHIPSSAFIWLMQASSQDLMASLRYSVE